MKNTLMFSALVAMTIACFAFHPADKRDWKAPSSEASKANAVKSSPESIAAGKELFEKKCASCHGKKGLGDGSKASELKTEPGDFSKADFQSQSDGSLFYKIEEGREDMPAFKKKIEDKNQVWNLVNFIRTLKK